MSIKIKTKQGLDIAIDGQAKQKTIQLSAPEIIKIIPDHFPIIPKLSVRVGDKIEAGSPVLHDKNNPQILVTSPVSGEVLEINRGDRRKILDITIRAEKQTSYKSFSNSNLANADAEALKTALLEAGLWPYIKQRPYDVMANPEASPKAIFISAYDSAPLAADIEYLLKGEEAAFQAGLDAVAKLSKSKVCLGVKAGTTYSAFAQAKSVELVELEGPHPVGNPSVMMHEIMPINKGDIVWTLTPLAVLFIGRFVQTNQVDFTKLFALTGPEVKSPQYYKTIVGANIAEAVNANVSTDKHLRYISGNVLTGTQIPADGCLQAADTQVTVIAEGDEQHEMLGWAMPRLNKFSVNRTYFSWLLGKKLAAKFDARVLGGERAIIMSGEYDKVFPFDILPEFLIKAMITDDIDKMEALGIYEVIPEDFALCEYVCTSKLEIQKIAREAIANMRAEME